jgi:hypothetical protein
LLLLEFALFVVFVVVFMVVVFGVFLIAGEFVVVLVVLVWVDDEFLDELFSGDDPFEVWFIAGVVWLFLVYCFVVFVWVVLVCIFVLFCVLIGLNADWFDRVDKFLIMSTLG